MCATTRGRGAEHLPTAPVARWTAHRVGASGQAGDEQARVGAAEGLGGGVGVAEQHEVDAADPRRPAAAAAGRRELLGVVDDDEPQAGARSRSRAVGSASRWSAAAPRIQAGSKAPGADRAVTSSYSRSTWAAATHSGRPWAARAARGPRGRGRLHRPASAGRAARRGSCAWAGPGAPSRATAAPTITCRMTGQQLTEDDVLLRAEHPN